MMARAMPNEFLVVVRRGELSDRGLGGRAWLWPGESAVRVPATQQEICFEMTQETSDGIPLRFKGIVIYRIARPAHAARRFDFVGGGGLEQIRQRLAHVCLGELRALAASMTMQACIEGRKTTLTEAVRRGLLAVIEDAEAGSSWGIDLDVMQVAQVFIIDEDLRKKLEARVRDKVRASSELSRIETDERVRLAQLDSERARLDAEAPVKKLRLTLDAELIAEELAARRLEVQLAELRALVDTQPTKLEHERRKEILRLEQDATIAQSLAGMWQGAHVSVYGDEAKVMGTVAPVVDLLIERLRAARG
ncbi:MAG: hypothetical protein HYS27_14255 [Deltaproteobacteria bacterium]|nr:hypothetical protein [Deltaproteobacteria bacterium]